MADRSIRVPADALAGLNRHDVVELRALVERIRLHEGDFGYVQRLKPTREGGLGFGFTVENPLVDASVRWLDSKGLVDRAFVGAAESAVGRLPERGDVGPVVAAFDTAEVLGLLTRLVLADRFCEGALVGVFDNGTMPALFDRLLVLAAES